MAEFTHFNTHGDAIMVDVSEKKDTLREATARGRILMNKECFQKVRDGQMKKGDVLQVARVAGIMGTKKTSDLIPLCHILNLSKVEIDFEPSSLFPQDPERAICKMEVEDYERDQSQQVGHYQYRQGIP